MDYTKGEWTTKTMIDGTIIIKAPDGKCPATVWDCPEAEANAHLIAAAPDMYEALKLYQSHQEGTSGHYCWKCAEAINKALAKAGGK